MSKLDSKGRITAGLALVTAIAMTAVMLMFTGGSPANSAVGHGAGAGSGSLTTVAHSAEGHAASKIVGTTEKGQRVSGSFTPTSFSKKNGHLKVRGMVNGVIHQANGSTKTFSGLHTFTVKSINGTTPGAAPARTANRQAACNVLNLVLGPLDLNLLGLTVHLDKVVLNIVAQSGAGQLLGNLLCAVAHLLDTGGTLSQLLTKLGAILDQLLMGL